MEIQNVIVDHGHSTSWCQEGLSPGRAASEHRNPSGWLLRSRRCACVLVYPRSGWTCQSHAGRRSNCFQMLMTAPMPPAETLGTPMSHTHAVEHVVHLPTDVIQHAAASASQNEPISPVQSHGTMTQDALPPSTVWLLTLHTPLW